MFSARVALFEQDYPDRAARQRFLDEVGQRLAALPGVEATALADSMPVTGSGSERFRLEGQEYRSENDRPDAHVAAVSPSFFATVGSHLVAGRDFTAGDRDGSPAGDREPVLRAPVPRRRRAARQAARDRRPGRGGSRPADAVGDGGGRRARPLHGRHRQRGAGGHVRAARAARPLLRQSARPHARRADGARPAGARDGHQRRSQPAALLRALAGGGDPPADLVLPGVRYALHGVRRGGAAARRGRALRGDVVLRRPAAPGGRRPHGARRRSQAGGATDLPPGSPAGPHRARYWPPHRAAALALPAHGAVRRQPVGPVDLRAHRDGARGDRGGCVRCRQGGRRGFGRWWRCRVSEDERTRPATGVAAGPKR